MSSIQSRSAILTARRRADGATVFLDFEGDWSEHVTSAVVANGPDEHRALRDRAGYEATRDLVADPHLVELQDVDGKPMPMRQRAGAPAAGGFAEGLGDRPPSRTGHDGTSQPLAALAMAWPPQTDAVHRPLPQHRPSATRSRVCRRVDG